jgi:hypothetical protein
MTCKCAIKWGSFVFSKTFDSQISFLRAGEPLEKVSDISLLNAPPVSVLMDQQLIENETKRADGEKVKTSYIEQQFFAVGCSATTEGLTLYPIDISVHLDTPTAGKSHFLCDAHSEFATARVGR